MKVSPLQGNFGSGEVSPLLYGNVEADRYKSGLAVCKNYIPTLQGGLIRRSGTYYVGDVKTSSAMTRLVRFEFSTTQAYVIEFGNLYCRFYKDNAQIAATEIVTTYATAHLFDLKFTQSADTLYITHPSYPPRKITRTSHTVWTITTITFLDGPYLATNTTTTTLTPSAFAPGAGVTLTASAVTGINGNAGFAATDVGRHIRLQQGTVWGYVLVTGWTSTTVVTVTVINTLTSVAAKATWRLGLWSDTTGYPSCVTFHEDRLFFAGTLNYPQRLDGSKSSDYENFEPSSVAAGAVASDNAVSFSLTSNDVNAIRWLASDEKGLLAGSMGGEWVVRPSSQSEALSPTNVNAKRSTSYGSDNLQPVQVGKATMFIQRAGRKLREMMYFYDVEGFRAPDLTQLSEHITETGIVEMAYQKEPQTLIWCVRTDGVLAVLNYEREVDSFRVGWTRVEVGGVSNAANDPAVVESVCSIPSPDGTRDEVWIIVKRYINGATVRQVEYFERFFDDEVEQQDAFFVDCGLTYDSPLVITGATAANPVVVTSVGHGLSNGDTIRIVDVKGMTQLNGETFTIANVAANTMELSGINGTAYTTYVSGGEVRKEVTAMSGLSHLNGQSVSILTDGAVHPNKTVSGGALTLDYKATVVQIGLSYNADGQLLRLEAGAGDGTALGKTRRNNRAGFLLHRSLGFNIGMDFDNLDAVTFRTSADPQTRAPGLFSGVLSETIDADYDYENQICWRQNQPLPSMVLAVMPQMYTQDRG